MNPITGESSFTVEQYQALVSAVAQGALTVKYGDKEVTYRSLDEMIRVKALMEAELGAKTRPDRRLGDFYTGFE